MSHGRNRPCIVRCSLLLVCCMVFVYHWNETKLHHSLWKRSSYESLIKVRNGPNATNGNSSKHSSANKQIQKPVVVSIERVPTSFLPWNVSFTLRSNPLPNLQSIQRIFQYYLQHSVDAVLLDAVNLPERQFAVAFLPCRCDLTSGAVKVWHNFFNTLAWSIITNRTVIVQWYDPDLSVDGIQTIDSLDRNFICPRPAKKGFATDSEELPLADWFLQWDDIQRLDANDLYQELIVPIPLDVKRQNYDALHRIVAFPQISSLQYRTRREVDAFFHNEWTDHPLSENNGVEYIKFMNDWSRHVALLLFLDGSDFLYGAFFHICFPSYNVDTPISPFPTLKSSPEPAAVSFALMTLHETMEENTDDGSDDSNDDGGDDDGTTSFDISEEIKCLRRLLPLKTDRKTSQCQIVLLSNNPMIVDQLAEWISSSKRSCKVRRLAPRDDDQKGAYEESSGATIPLSDLRFASTIVRTGIIGPPNHPSYQLLVEWVEFQRTLFALEGPPGRRKEMSIATSTNTSLPPLLWCDL